MVEHGNLAFEPLFQDSDQALDWANPLPSAARRMLLEDPISRTVSLQEKAKKVRHNLTIRRYKNLAGLILLIITVSAIFSTILWRQAMILEQNFGNLKMERTIKKTNQETGQIAEALAARTDLEQIKLQAITELGLQEPAHKQVVTVDIPNTDRVVFAGNGNRQVSQEVMLADSFTAIEGFFKTLSIPGQTP
ncbi:MAG: hypothetical protein PHC86_01695 [Eubacteriales bacterium]|nr:hypothetical protein [Eubacteriales bacterium]